MSKTSMQELDWLFDQSSVRWRAESRRRVNYSPQSGHRPRHERVRNLIAGTFAASSKRGFGGGGVRGYQIARSLRFRSSGPAYLTRTPSAGTSNKIFTICGWVKKNVPIVPTNTLPGIFSAPATTYDDHFGFSGVAAGSPDCLGFIFDGTISGTVYGTPKYRDPSAWMFFMAAVDTTQATAANRVHLYAGNAEVAYTTASYPAQNYATGIGKAVAHYIGKRAYNGEACDLQFAEFYYIDGQQLTPSSFTQTDASTGQLVPKAYTGTYGANGAYLPFSDNSALTSGSNAGIGKDFSGNGNYWNTTNISVTAGVTNDSLTDTPTNYGTDTGAGGEVRGNYATFNPIHIPSNLAASNGNLKLTKASGAAWSASPATIAMTSGKFFAEAGVSVGASQGLSFAVCGVSVFTTDIFGGDVTPGLAQFEVVATSVRGALFANGSTNLGTPASNPTLTTSDRFLLAIDCDAGKAWAGFYDQSAGTTEWYDSTAGTTGNPATGANPTITFAPNTPMYFMAAAHTGGNIEANFGQRPWEAPCPSGFKALCTQNLPDPAIKKPANGFVAATDSGANIAATLTAARPSTWTDFFNIYKRRDTTGQWYFNASGDITNAIACPTLATKAALSLSGTSFIGYSVRCDSGYPARTGTVSHTNGVANTITNNLGTARRLIWLVREDAAGVHFYQYHPDGASGKLTYLDASTIETTDGAITNVTSNAFEVGASLATGTYRYFEIAETAGFFALGKYTGNASADGPYPYCGLSAKLFFQKRLDSAADGIVRDRVRSTYNPSDAISYTDLANGEFTATRAADLISGGVKVRSTDVDQNASGGTYIFMAMAETAGKYARAR